MWDRYALVLGLFTIKYMQQKLGEESWNEVRRGVSE